MADEQDKLKKEAAEEEAERLKQLEEEQRKLEAERKRLQQLV